MLEVELALGDRLRRDDMTGDMFLKCFRVTQLDIAGMHTGHVGTTICMCHGGRAQIVRFKKGEKNRWGYLQEVWGRGVYLLEIRNAGEVGD